MSTLTVNNLSCQKGYNNLFEEISFVLNSGDILRVSGSNGSGKTSLLKILAGISTSESGNIYFNKNSVGSTEYQKNIFYLGHLPALSSELYCQENLDYLLQLNGNNTNLYNEALSKVGLKGFEKEYTGNLSAGQKRRVVLATLYTTQSKIWLLDEPFTALDTAGIKSLEKQIMKHCESDGICIFTSHQDTKLPNPRVLEL